MKSHRIAGRLNCPACGRSVTGATNTGAKGDMFGPDLPPTPEDCASVCIYCGVALIFTAVEGGLGLRLARQSEIDDDPAFARIVRQVNQLLRRVPSPAAFPSGKGRA